MALPQLLLVVGVQKSGTTLLSRLLKATKAVASPFHAEGDLWWGNEPVMAPTAHPAGTIYQRSQGAAGHEIGAEDATPEIRAHLVAGLPATESRPILNKNPFNTVRLPWLRALFPDAFIVAMVRRPVPNVFSLTKKYVPHEGRGVEPDQGWWGVKPSGWREIVADDKVLQSARQWRAVNDILVRDRALANMVLSYQRLCDEPERCVREILSGATGRPYRGAIEPAPIRCLDDEYLRGAAARSKNRRFMETKSLAVPEGEDIEVPALDPADVKAVLAECGGTEARFPELR